MALNIKDPETDRLARDLADLTGESITDAVKSAIKERLAHERRRHGKTIDRAAVQAIIRRVASRPVLDDREPDHIIGYDRNGLPS